MVRTWRRLAGLWVFVIAWASLSYLVLIGTRGRGPFGGALASYEIRQARADSAAIAAQRATSPITVTPRGDTLHAVVYSSTSRYSPPDRRRSIPRTWLVTFIAISLLAVRETVRVIRGKSGLGRAATR